MTQEIWWSLILTTLRDPRQAAETIMSWRIDRSALWTALALVALLNTLAFLLAVQSSPQMIPLPIGPDQPLAVFILLTGMMVVYVHSLHWAGTMIGGDGRLEDVLAVVVWLQTLRAGAQFILVLAALIAPLLANLLSLIVIIWGLWILVNFIAAATRLQSIGAAIGALIFAGILLIIGLGVLTGILGFLLQGVMR
ncbi:MAG: Yip1 family protein [Pseudomonadota bacterium]